MEPESALEESYVNLSGDPYYLPDKEVSIAAAGHRISGWNSFHNILTKRIRNIKYYVVYLC